MRHLSTIHDPVYTEKPLTAFEQFWLRFIRDKRDLPFLFLCMKIGFSILPVAVSLYFAAGALWWGLAAVFVALEVYFMGPFVLMLHNTSHNVFFKQEYKWGNRLIPWGLCPFMGQSPDTYFSHHIGMHHAENNLEPDKSTTMPYQRDSALDFMKYFFRFLLIGIFDLFAYHRMKGKSKFLKKAIIGEATLFVVVGLLLWVDWKSTLLVFIAPLLIVRFFMMAGNWAQHAFIDREQPHNNYLNSITCINSAYNRKCWNDGYHIGHHLKPHLHWTEMPKDFLANADKYAQNKALVFEGLDYNQIWAMLMFKRYDRLAEHLVNINGAFPSKEAAVQLLRERTRKF